MYFIIYILYSMLNIYKLKKNSIRKNIISKKGYIIEESKYNYSFTKEWFNSVYSYNKNNQKTLPSINIIVSKIIKSYFNMFSIKLEKSILIRRVAKWKRRLKLNRILLGKPEFKHTNDKVIITLYVYNRELLLLNKKINSIKRKIYIQYFFKLIVKNRLKIFKINLIRNLLKKFNILKKKLYKLTNYRINRKKIIYKSIKMRKLMFKNYVYINLKEVWNKIKNIKTNANKNIYLFRSLNRLEKKVQKLQRKNIIISKTPAILEYVKYIKDNDNSKLNNIFKKLLNIKPKFNLDKLMYIKTLKKIIMRTRLYLRYHRIIYFNKSKFNIFIIPLKIFLEKIYKKEVEFNIVNLKNYHLDSDILTQIMAIKLRNRKNRVGKVIRKVVSKIKLPFSKRLQYYELTPKSISIQNLLIKQVINNNIYYAMPNITKKIINNKSSTELLELSIIESNKDKLNMILNLSYPMEYITSKTNINQDMKYIIKRNFKNTVLDSIKNKAISGIKVEASGRLSKRITASKSIHTMVQKGTTKEVNSSYKRLSSVLLRGNLKSNIQFSKISNKTRIGAFGIKGWIGSV